VVNYDKMVFVSGVGRRSAAGFQLEMCRNSRRKNMCFDQTLAHPQYAGGVSLKSLVLSATVHLLAQKKIA
jgi:hypothetical protein